MIVYTQRQDPGPLEEGARWLPCLQSHHVEHTAARKGPLLITHMEALNNYQHSLEPFLDEPIYSVGNKSWDRLNAKGFKNINWYETSKDIPMVAKSLAPLTWLCGDSHARDFSSYDGVDQLQTYHTELHIPNCNELAEQNPAHLYVYSRKVLSHLESIKKWRDTILHYTPSCEPDHVIWKRMESFNPSTP